MPQRLLFGPITVREAHYCASNNIHCGPLSSIRAPYLFYLRVSYLGILILIVRKSEQGVRGLLGRGNQRFNVKFITVFMSAIQNVTTNFKISILVLLQGSVKSLLSQFDLFILYYLVSCFSKLYGLQYLSINK